MALAHRRIAIVAGIAAIGLVAMGSASSQDVMLYNGTPSMPVGFYLRTSGEVERGAIVTVHAVDVAPGYAAERNVTDPGDRFLKRAGHHALMAQVGPIFEAGFIAHSFAKRVGKVTHRAIKAYERYRDRRAFVLRCDVFRFLPAIDHAIFRRLLCRACPRSWPGIPGDRSRAWQGHAPIRTQGHESYFSYSSN